MAKFELKPEKESTVVKEESKKTVVLEVPEKLPLTRYMLGTFIHPVTGEWMLAQAKFNPITGEVGEFSTERCAGDWIVMQERMQIKINSLGLLEKDNQ